MFPEDWRALGTGIRFAPEKSQGLKGCTLSGKKRHSHQRLVFSLGEEREKETGGWGRKGEREGGRAAS